VLTHRSAHRSAVEKSLETLPCRRVWGVGGVEAPGGRGQGGEVNIDKNPIFCSQNLKNFQPNKSNSIKKCGYIKVHNFHYGV
jgi:hypothetical protein